MKVLTYNVWHGFDDRGIVRRVPFERAWRVRVRWQAVLREISKAQAGLVLLQEVNPLPHKMRELEEVLSLESAGTVDNSGLKINGFGFPVNLQSGLCTLVAEPFRITSLTSLKLSGDRQAVKNHSFQFRESRYGLLTVLDHPTWGRGLVINCHLHHGPQWSEKHLDYICTQLTARQREEVFERICQGDRRRTEEAQVIFDYLGKENFDWVIWGGDFNADTRSRLYQTILRRGFKDVCGASDSKICTWDRYNNKENHELQEKFYLPLDFKGIGLNEGQKSALWEGLKEQGGTVKRIDHLFFKSVQKIKIRGACLFATENVQGYDFKPSDHFGLMVDLDLLEENE